MEMHSAFERERARRNRFNVELDQQIGQLRRDVLSATSTELLTHLGQARILNTNLLDEIQARSARIVRLVAGQEPGFRGADLLPLTQSCLDSALTVPEVLNQPTDSLILRVISEHAVRHPDEERVFLSANLRDFRNDPYVAEHLDNLGLRFFADTVAFLGWFRARP